MNHRGMQTKEVYTVRFHLLKGKKKKKPTHPNPMWIHRVLFLIFHCVSAWTQMYLKCSLETCDSIFFNLHLFFLFFLFRRKVFFFLFLFSRYCWNIANVQIRKLLRFKQFGNVILASLWSTENVYWILTEDILCLARMLRSARCSPNGLPAPHIILQQCSISSRIRQTLQANSIWTVVKSRNHKNIFWAFLHWSVCMCFSQVVNMSD